MDSLLKFKKEVLVEYCNKNKLRINKSDSKKDLVNKIVNQSGGRIYECIKGNEKKFVNSRIKPNMNEWICEETQINSAKTGCSFGPKPGMRCVSCIPGKNGKKPQVCDACAASKDTYYCHFAS